MKILIPVQGGLGNQLFQVASGIGLSAKHKASLVLDHRSNYSLDFRYRRKYELSYFDTNTLAAIPGLALFALSRYFIQLFSTLRISQNSMKLTLWKLMLHTSFSVTGNLPDTSK